MTAAAGPAPYIIALIAVGGTLLGGITAGTFGLIQARRVQQGQRQDAWLRFYDERSGKVWTERRLVYAQLLKAADDFLRAVKEYNMSTGDEEALRIHNLVRLSECRNNYESVLYELYVLGHIEVVKCARDALELMSAASRAVAHLENCDIGEIELVIKNMINAVRESLLKLHPEMVEVLREARLAREARESKQAKK